MKKTKTRKQSITTLRKTADRLLQLKYVPLNPRCFVCGQLTQVMHHFIPKSQSNYLRYRRENLIALCNKCHARHHLSGDPFIVAEIIKYAGNDWNNKLQTDRHILLKINKGYLQEVIEGLEK